MARLNIQVRTSLARRQQVYEEVIALSAPTLSYYVRVVISTVIATYGLLANSTAVVIGAMLVAPLMGPIFGIALGLSVGDRRLFRNASVAEVFGASLAVIIGLCAGLVPLNLGFGSEIIARTQPTLYDLIVALASGVAGAYAVMDERVSASLPGVAIATAIVPPLATCGLCLSAAHWDWALGAFLLFSANFLAVELAAAAVFIAFGMLQTRPFESLTIGRVLRRFGFSLAALLLIGTFMTRTLITLIRERSFSKNAEAIVSEAVRSSVGAAVSDVHYEKRSDHTLDLIATVLTPQEFVPSQVASIEAALRRQLDPRIHLIIRSLISRDFDAAGPVFVPRNDRERRQDVDRQTAFLTQMTKLLNEQLGAITGARLVEVRRESDQNPVLVTAVVRVPTAIRPARVAVIEAALSHATATPIHLVIRSVLARDADSTGFLYGENTAAIPLGDPVQQRLDAALRQEVGRRDGARLLELRYVRRDDRLLVHAVVRTPEQLKPWEVAQLESGVRKAVDPTIDLIVRSVVGTDTAAAGYIAAVNDSDLHVSAPPPPLILPSVRFASGTARIGPEEIAGLDAVARALRDQGSPPLIIEGHTDDSGHRQDNDNLALLRALAVRDFLISRRIAPQSLEVVSLGASQPIADNGTPEGAAQNRRVELRPRDAAPPANAASK